MDRRDFLTRIIPGSLAAMYLWPRIGLSAVTANGRAWNHLGVPYPTDALPGIAGNSSSIPIMPTLPNGAYFTAHDWYSGNLNSYDPCTVPVPTPTDPDNPTQGEYVVNKFHPNASDSNGGGLGTVNAPRATLPTTGSSSHSFTAGTKIFVYGDNTPLPTSNTNNRKVDYTQWDRDDLTFQGTVTAPCWVVGIDKPRIATNDGSSIVSSTHLLFDGIILDDSGSSTRGGTIGLSGCEYVTFRNGAQFGAHNDAGAAHFNVSSSKFVMYFNNECAYGGYWDGTSSSIKDWHAVRPDYVNRYVWIIGNKIHHFAGDSIQTGNSSNSRPQADTSHFVFFSGNECYSNAENAIDLKNVYHFIGSQNDLHSFTDPKDAATVVIVSNNDEGPWTAYHWLIGNIVRDSIGPAIRFAGDQSDEVAWIIGNVIYNMTGDGIATWNVGPNNTKGVAYNTIFNCTGNGINMVPGNTNSQPSSSCYVHSNIVKDVDGNAILGYTGSNDWDVAEVKDNFSHSNSKSYSITGDWTVVSNNEMNVDPQLSNPESADFSLSSTSPAKAYTSEDRCFTAFRSLYGLDIQADYLGNARPITSWSVGATEETSNPPSPPQLLTS